MVPCTGDIDGEMIPCSSTNPMQVSVVGATFSSAVTLLNYKLASAAATTNDTNIKASAGKIYHIFGRNSSTGERFLHLYNKASAPVTGTDVPVLTIPLPPAATFHFTFPEGINFTTGISYSLSTGVADSDTGVLTAGDVKGLGILYA